MSKFKVGDPLTIKIEHRSASWYTTNILYVSRIVPKGEQGPYELLELYHPICSGNTWCNIFLHESKLELNLHAICTDCREMKLNEIGI